MPLLAQPCGTGIGCGLSPKHGRFSPERQLPLDIRVVVGWVVAQWEGELRRVQVDVNGGGAVVVEALPGRVVAAVVAHIGRVVAEVYLSAIGTAPIPHLTTHPTDPRS